MNTRGQWAESCFKKAMNSVPGIVCLKWPDFKSFIQVECPRCKHHFRSRYQAPKAPSDFELFKNDKYAFIEVKSCKNSASYIFRSGDDNYIRDHQFTYGWIFNEMGGRYYFLLFHGKEEVFLMLPNVLKRLIEENAERTRIRWEIIRDNAIISLKIGARPKIFPPEQLLEAIFDVRK